MFKHKAYFIETLTNTHVGSGDAGYSFADNVIQKDPVTSLPVFHASSIKGSIRDHFEQYLGENLQGKGSGEIKKTTFLAIFGGEEKEQTKKKDDKEQVTSDEKKDDKSDEEEKLLKDAPKHGLVKFHEARLLTLPLRSSSLVYHNGTSPDVVIDYLETLKQLKAKNIEQAEIENLLKFIKDIEKKLDEETKQVNT